MDTTTAHRTRFDKFMIALSEAYNTQIKTARIDLYWHSVGEMIQGPELEDLYRKILRTSEFFPTPAKMLELSGKKPSSSREDAENWIDEAIHLFAHKPTEAYEIMGQSNYNYAKSIGMDPFGLRSGNQNPAFERSRWIDKLERDWSSAANPAQLEEHDSGAFFRELEKKTQAISKKASELGPSK